MVNRAQFTLTVNGRHYVNHYRPIHDCSTDLGVAQEKLRFFREHVRAKEEDIIMKGKINCCGGRFTAWNNLQKYEEALNRSIVLLLNS